MAKQITLKKEDLISRQFIDRLLLEKLFEMESVVKVSELAERLADHGVGLATVKAFLASNPDRFAYSERRWVPASRLLVIERPLHAVLHETISRFGGPMPIDLLVSEASRVHPGEAQAVQSQAHRILRLDRLFTLVGDNKVALSEWGFEATDELPERAFGLNGVSAEEVEEAKAKTKEIDWRIPEAVANALAALAPVRLKVLGAVAFSSVNSADPRSYLIYDARTFLADALGAPGYVYTADGWLYPESETKKWLSHGVKLSDKLAPTLEIEDAAPLEIKPEDISKLVKRIQSKEGSTPAIRLLEEVYEVTPGSKSFRDDLQGMIQTLRAAPGIVWVGGDRFRPASSIPDMVLEVPEPFEFPVSEVEDEEGERIDVELTDDGLSSSLRKLLQHPLAMDVLDEDIQPAAKQIPDTIRLVLKSIHRELGTFPMCQIPTGFLDAAPDIQELLVVDPNGRELSVWANLEGRLLYNWIDWWFEQPVECGAVFTLTKTSRPNVFEFAWLDQPDPVLNINSQRMEELRAIGAEAEGKSTLDLLIQVMSHWPKGVDYLTLLAEINVVRRSTRRLIASLLSSYQCFYQRSGSPVWHYDAKKVELGFDKSKRKFIRK